MRLDVLHRTTYRYRRPVVLGPHRLALSPRAGHDVHVVSSKIFCEPNAELRETEDVFGNKVIIALFDAPSDTLIIENRLSVEQTSPDWPVFRIAVEAMNFPFRYSTDEIADLGALREPQTPDGEGSVASWARTFPLGDAPDTLSLLKDLNASILGFVRYRTREEEGTQSPAQTLAIRSGSCRDIAALFIEAARQLGFGARAVSGYLYDPHADQGEPGATHAWAEVYLPEAGWISFDPTHARVGNANLITTAVGRRNDQIMPILGSFAGAPGDFVDLAVAVTVTTC